MSQVSVLGIDYSISSPGLCLYNGDTYQWWVKYLPKGKEFTSPANNVTFTPYPDVEGIPRYLGLTNWVEQVLADNILSSYPIKYVWMEDYAFGANGRLTQLAENAGILKARLHQNWPTICFKTIAPGTLKKFATGSGHAKKEQMWESFVKDYPDAVGWPKIVFPKSKSLKIPSPLNDLADAFYLARYGYSFFNQKKA